MRRLLVLAVFVLAPAAAFAPSAASVSMNHEISILKALLAYGTIAGLVLYPLIRGVMEYHDTRSPLAFLPLLLVVVLIGGVWSWFGYFVTHGGFFLWPVFILGLLAVIALFRALHQQREIQRRADELQEFPEPPQKGGPANPDDFKDWV